jgi:predicted RNase H-like nuclease (RuvC/YqgF family)
MEKLKNYIEFINEEQTFGEKLQFQLNQYKTRKGNLENLILNNLDEELGDKVKTITEDNPFLMHYGNLLKLKRRIKKKELKIKDINTNIENLRKDLSLINKLESGDDKERQKSVINEKIEKAQTKQKTLREEISEIEEKYSELEKQMGEIVKTRESQLQEIQSNS